MANPLFQQFGKNGVDDVVRQVKEFQKTFKGNPKEIVENMVRSGQIPQHIFNELAQEANALMPFLK